MRKNNIFAQMMQFLEKMLSANKSEEFDWIFKVKKARPIVFLYQKQLPLNKSLGR